MHYAFVPGRECSYVRLRLSLATAVDYLLTCRSSGAMLRVVSPWRTLIHAPSSEAESMRLSVSHQVQCYRRVSETSKKDYCAVQSGHARLTVPSETALVSTANTWRYILYAHACIYGVMTTSGQCYCSQPNEAAWFFWLHDS